MAATVPVTASMFRPVNVRATVSPFVVAKLVRWL